VPMPLAGLLRLRRKNEAAQVTATFDPEQIAARFRNPAVKVISFDVFDTLLRRRVMDPHHVFGLMGQALARRGHDYRWTRRVEAARLHAWHLALDHARMRGREETSLEEIYRVFGAVLPEACPHLAEIKALELDIEKRLLEAYPLGRTLFEAALRSGKRVVLCSDQYLPKAFIETVLTEAGYQGYEHFFLSGELGILKAKGSLYDWMCLRLDVRRDAILHVGDTGETDYRTATFKGLEALLIPKSLDYAGHAARGSAVGRSAGLQSIASAAYLHGWTDALAVPDSLRPELSDNYLHYLGYALLGPLLVGLSRWIAEKLAAGTHERFWFLSRDGEGLYQVFLLLYPEYEARVDYVYASRRLLTYTSGELSAAEVFRHYSHLLRSGVSVHEFIEAAFGGLEGRRDLLREFRPEDRLRSPEARRRVSHHIDHFIRAGGLNESPQARRARRYYRDKLQGARNIGIFDVGWMGNLQRSLNRMLAEEAVDITGYYLGYVFEPKLPKDIIKADSFAFSFNFPEDSYQEIASCLWVVEYLFASTHLSVVDLEETTAGFAPVFEDSSPAKEELRAAGRILQASALRFVRDTLRWDRSALLDFADREALTGMLREFIARPAAADGRAFESRKAVTGVDEADGQPLVAPLTQARNGRAIVRGERLSAWKAGYAAAVGEDIVRRCQSRDPRFVVTGFLKRYPRLWRPLSAVARKVWGLS
jgi:predicted HAD superfamily hydrolase